MTIEQNKHLTKYLTQQKLSIVVMGVCGTGKSTIGEKLAFALNIKFIDGDDLHPIENITKMSHGYALNDEDRQPWLKKIQSLINEYEIKNEPLVVVCSALKKSYRDIIRHNNHPTFIFLHGEKQLIEERLAQRKNHFMKPNMLETQLDTLEIPDETIEPDVQFISINKTIDEIIHQAIMICTND